MFEVVLKIFMGDFNLGNINHTLVTLVPKVENPELITQFGPISLCNVIYKCIKKIIVNMIKHLLPEWISPLQARFIPGRCIQDKVIISQELLNCMRKMNGKKAYMAIKIDLEKAYDRVSWEAIQYILDELSFPVNLKRLVMDYVTSSSFNILWNGEKTNLFRPTRGICQGDPLSPYLFMLCMEKLTQLINDRMNSGHWKTIRAG